MSVLSLTLLSLFLSLRFSQFFLHLQPKLDCYVFDLYTKLTPASFILFCSVQSCGHTSKALCLRSGGESHWWGYLLIEWRWSCIRQPRDLSPGLEPAAYSGKDLFLFELQTYHAPLKHKPEAEGTESEEMQEMNRKRKQGEWE